MKSGATFTGLIAAALVAAGMLHVAQAQEPLAAPSQPAQPLVATSAKPVDPAPPGATISLPRTYALPAEYPELSLRREDEGRAAIQFCIDENGRGNGVVLTHPSGFPRLDEATLKWAIERPHVPGTVDGKAVKFYNVVREMRFALER